MSAASLPSYRPVRFSARHVVWYALLLVLLLLAFVALAATLMQQAPPADPQLLGPFRWMRADGMA